MNDCHAQRKDERVTIGYKIRKFTVHTLRIGGWSDDTVEEVGPDYDGFMITVRTQEHPYRGSLSRGFSKRIDIKAAYRDPYYYSLYSLIEFTERDCHATRDVTFGEAVDMEMS